MEADIFQISRKAVQLLDSEFSVTVRTVRGREMLETGLLPLVRSTGKEPTEEEAKRILKQAQRTVMACAVYPKIVERETSKRGEVCIRDISDADVFLLFKEIITLSDTRFFGTNRTAFDPVKNLGLIQAQQKVCYWIDYIARRYSISPLDILRWNDDEINTVLAIISGAEDHKQKNEDKG